VPDERWSTADAAAALQELIPPGSSIMALEAGDCTVLSLTGRAADVLMTFRWRHYPYLLGLGAPRTISYSSADEHLSAEGWASDAYTWLQEELSTGVLARASRAHRGSFIELVEPDLPNDSRFYMSGVGPEDDVAWEALEYFEKDGFNAGSVRAARADATLISWERAYLNTRTASRYVGHAAAVTVDSTTARLLLCDVAPNVPDTVYLDLCLGASHQASWTRARIVQTALDHAVLDTIGFRRVGDLRELTTDFLDVDHDAYRQILHKSRRWKPPRRKHPWLTGVSFRAGL
jgi:hypothetical protein